ncbi:MAG TPA: hypothetical protein VFA45_10540, partial [Actinomycetes bacterium]|nr:hypothetical protein [Actinomycetes bacterium]
TPGAQGGNGGGEPRRRGENDRPGGQGGQVGQGGQGGQGDQGGQRQTVLDRVTRWAGYLNFEFGPGDPRGQSGGIPGGMGRWNLGAFGQLLYIGVTVISTISLVKSLVSGAAKLLRGGLRALLRRGIGALKAALPAARAALTRAGGALKAAVPAARGALMRAFGAVRSGFGRLTTRGGIVLRSSDKLMGVERASAELIEAVSKRRTVRFALEGSEELRYLEHIGAEANVGGETMTHILLRENPSKAAILEEFLHGTQHRLGLIDRLGVSGAETHVKDFMIRHRRLLGLGDEDVRILEILKGLGL